MINWKKYEEFLLAKDRWHGTMYLQMPSQNTRGRAYAHACDVVIENKKLVKVCKYTLIHIHYMNSDVCFMPNFNDAITQINPYQELMTCPEYAREAYLELMAGL